VVLAGAVILVHKVDHLPKEGIYEIFTGFFWGTWIGETGMQILQPKLPRLTTRAIFCLKRAS
jgi:hypothetical protein